MCETKSPNAHLNTSTAAYTEYRHMCMQYIYVQYIKNSWYGILDSLIARLIQASKFDLNTCKMVVRKRKARAYAPPSRSLWAGRNGGQQGSRRVCPKTKRHFIHPQPARKLSIIGGVTLNSRCSPPRIPNPSVGHERNLWAARPIPPSCCPKIAFLQVYICLYYRAWLDTGFALYWKSKGHHGRGGCCADFRL